MLLQRMNILGRVTLIVGWLALTTSSQANLVVDFTASDSAADYSQVFFSGVTVAAGDYLVVAHSNNKRDNGNNDISIAGAGSNSFTSLSAGDTGSGQGAWLFYSQIGSAGTFDLTLDSSNATKTVSQASTVWVVRAAPGEVVTLASTDTGVIGSGTSLDLDFSFASSLTNGFGFGAGTTGDALGLASGWTAPLSNGTGKRNTLFNNSVTGPSLTSTFTTTNSSGIVLSGIVLTSTAVPEPTSAMLFGLGVVVSIGFRRRQRAK